MAPNDFKGLGEKVSSDKDQSIDDGSRCRPGCWKRSHMSVTVWKRPAAHTRQWRDQVLFFSFSLFSHLENGAALKSLIRSIARHERAENGRLFPSEPIRQVRNGWQVNPTRVVCCSLTWEKKCLLLFFYDAFPFLSLYLHFSLFFSYIHLKVLQSGTTRLLGFPLREDYTQQNAFLWATSSSGRGRLSQKKKIRNKKIMCIITFKRKSHGLMRII